MLKNSTLSNIIKIYGITDFNVRVKLFTLISLALISSLLELSSMAGIYPLINQESNSQIYEIISYFATPNRIIIFNIIVACLILSNIVKLLILKYSSHLAYNLGASIISKIHFSIISNSSTNFIEYNSSKYLNIILNGGNDLVAGILMSINLVTNILMIILISTGFYIVSGPQALWFLIGILFLYSLVFKNSRKIIFNNSLLINTSFEKSIKIANESFECYKEIKILKLEVYFNHLFESLIFNARNLQAKNNYMSGSPKSLIEIFMLVAFILISSFSDETNITNNISFIAIILVLSQRLLPLVQNAYNSYTLLLSVNNSISQIINTGFLNSYKELANETKLNSNFTSEFSNFQIKNLSFKLNDIKLFSNLTIEFNKGEKIALVGPSGSGKSTLIEIILGFKKPTCGEIFINNEQIYDYYLNFGSYFAYVPQTIALIDTTIKNNIALGIKNDNIDVQKIEFLLDICLLNSQSLEQDVGQQGNKLSGGQKQRIAIARALYQNPSILILDEATSGLDRETEKKLVKNIYENFKDLTLLVVTHNKDLANHMDRIINLSEISNLNK